MYSRSDQPALGMSGVMESKAGSAAGAEVLRTTATWSASKAKVWTSPSVPLRAISS